MARSIGRSTAVHRPAEARADRLPVDDRGLCAALAVTGPDGPEAGINALDRTGGIGDRGSAALSAAIENLIVNAIEHGGPRIVVRALVIGKRLRLEVTDNGKAHRAADAPAARPK